MAAASGHTVLVLGGYGQTGRRVVTWLAARNPDLRIVVAGRDGERAARLATALDPTRSGRVVPAIVDAGDPISVRAGLAGVDLLGNDVLVAGEHKGLLQGEKRASMRLQPPHPAPYAPSQHLPA